MKKIKQAVLLLVLGIPLWGSTQEYRLGIDEMFALAEQNSRSIRTFALAEQEAEQAVRVARGAKLPSVDLSLSASYMGDAWLSDRNFTNGENAPMPHFGNNFALEASQVVYAGGALSSALTMAQLQHQIARLDTEKNRQEIRFLLIGSYLELYKLDNQTEVYVENVVQTRRLLADIRARLEQGVVLPNDVTRYELQLQSLELALTQIRNTRTIVNDQMTTTLGLPHQTQIVVDTCILESLPQPDSEQMWLRSAAAAPELQQAELGVAQSRLGVKLARAERLPSVAVIAADRFDGPIIIEVPPINKNLNYWYVGVGLKFNIASLYKSGRNVRKALYAADRAAEAELLLQEQLQTDVRAAHVRFGESFATCRMQEKSLELATQNYEVIRSRYLNDLALITDMLDADNAKLAAELQVANARINILFAYYKLRKTAGDL